MLKLVIKVALRHAFNVRSLRSHCIECSLVGHCYTQFRVWLDCMHASLHGLNANPFWPPILYMISKKITSLFITCSDDQDSSCHYFVWLKNRDSSLFCVMNENNNNIHVYMHICIYTYILYIQCMCVYVCIHLLTWIFPFSCYKVIILERVYYYSCYKIYIYLMAQYLYIYSWTKSAY